MGTQFRSRNDCALANCRFGASCFRYRLAQINCSETTRRRQIANSCTRPTTFSPKLPSFARLLDPQPPKVQEAFQFLLATAMHEAGKSELLSIAEVNGKWHYTFSGAGDVFSVVRPEMSREMERRVREEVREALVEEGLL